jgi:hypothetical protein
MTTMRDYLLANKENDACQEEMDALLEFLASCKRHRRGRQASPTFGVRALLFGW